jgi:hypothetical protein
MKHINQDGMYQVCWERFSLLLLPKSADSLIYFWVLDFNLSTPIQLLTGN